jgi:glycosyltransferase involved in cell wall biosynthesis
MQVALVIPCYNEAPRLSATFRLINEYFSSPNQHAITLIFVDDGSQDGTNSQLANFVNQPHTNFTTLLITHPHNRGKGAAIISGWQTTTADAYGFSDADLAYGLTAIEPSISTLTNHDAIIAKRLDQQTQYSFSRNISSRFLHFITRHLTGVKATSPQSGWKFVNHLTLTKILPKLTQDRFAFDLEFLLLLQAEQAAIHELALPFTQHTNSSVKTRDGIRYLTDLLAISDSLPYNRPTLYRQLALGILLVSFALYGWIIYYGYFFSDDFTGLWQGSQVLNNFSSFLSIHGATFFSPIINLYYATGLGLFGPSAPLFFISNILIHAAVAWLAGLLALEITNSRLNAWATALLVAIAGSSYEAIVWIGANMHSLATLSIIAALYCTVRLYKTAKWHWLILGLLSQLIAYGTKEISIVLLPFIVIAIWSIWRQHKFSFSPHLSKFLIASSFLWSAYVALEFILKRIGQSFAVNNYSLDWPGFARIPFAFLDLFLPLQAVDQLLSPLTATILGLATIVTSYYLIKKYWRLPALPLAFTVCLLGILPTIFFTVTNWWEPLASRYTYLPHLGASLLISGILIFTIKHNKQRVVHALTAILIVVSIAQFIFMIRAVTTEYAYVYKTGSTLAHAARLLDPTTVPTVYIHPEHPFRHNQSHIIGALNIYANYQQSQIIFLEPNERAALSPSAMLLYWEPEARQYELTSHDDIFDILTQP